MLHKYAPPTAAVVEAYEGRQRVISEALAEAIGVQLMQTLLGTSDEEMKREDTHVLHNFIFEIQALTKVDDFYGFWLQHTEKVSMMTYYHLPATTPPSPVICTGTP